MALETVRLTACFKLGSSVPDSLFQTYKRLVQEFLDYAHAERITSFKRLKSQKYHDLTRTTSHSALKRR